jgi:hypothetical protein
VSGTRAARERAARFVASFGDEAAQRRADVLRGAAPAASAEAALASWAQRSGVFSAAAGVDPLAALPVLGALADLRSLDGPFGRRLVEALARAQAGDGSFGAAASDEEARIFATGLIAGRLAGLRFVRQSLLDGAGDWLAERFTPERVAGFAWRPLAAYTACFANLAHPRSDDVLQWCGRELERGFRARRFGAVATARILLDCCAASIPGAQLAAPELVVALVSEQSDDGGWPPAGDGDRDASAQQAASVQRALDGLTALVRFG